MTINLTEVSDVRWSQELGALCKWNSELRRWEPLSKPSEQTAEALGKPDLLALIHDLCADARQQNASRNFGWARDTLENAKRAAEAYAILAAADADSERAA